MAGTEVESGFRDLPGLKAGYATPDDPVRAFYIPVLAHAKHLDRSAGFFRSSSLSVAARGLARLIGNGGRMRLLVGSELQRSDVEAIEAGASLTDVVDERLIALFEEPQDEVEKQRLRALAWMVSAGTLEVRVVLPRSREGYFHVKHGIATDHHGDRIAWEGSNNETRAGWVSNYEQFWVSASWKGDWPTRQVELIENSFHNLWEDQDPQWTTIPIPDAARRKLLTYAPESAPSTDPEEIDALAADREAVVAWWLRDVPQLLGMEGHIGATAAIQPWPHQHRVADEVVSRFPERFLLADEVGLGKTIEVGLILRDLLVSGRVEKCLILAPASVLIQWQDELREKFGIAVPIYDGHELIDPGPRNRTRSLSHPSQWTEEPVVLVSSQLAKRRDRRSSFWDGPEWDMVVVDEAHHARRKGYDPKRRRPNRLLELLEGKNTQPGLASKTRGLLLLTATPMQVHPIEVWDLITQLGLPGRWGAHETYFLRYFEELRKATTEWAEVNWELVAGMAWEELEHGGPVHADVRDRVKARIGWVAWERLQQSVRRPHRIKKMANANERHALLEVLEHLTPLRRRMHRNTRDLLRDYQKQGLLPAKLADRRPEPRWVEMAAEERALYDRVEEYISEFYNRYEQKRKGLGFVMTVYRRRLTSSLHALERSLTRRLDVLHGLHDTGLTDEDIEEDDLSTDVGETLEEVSDDIQMILTDEIQYVEDFLQDLRNLGSDTKYEQLVDDLDRALRRRPNVVIFTQFTDTMDYLRDRLRPVYGRRIACYSGRGGERWADNGWQRVGKEEIKLAFRNGDIQILLGNDAMAEGLNLQSCGVEINYDVPWNPMRLEQRIGRVDRIGQRFNTVWIWSYFLEGTIEAEVYRRLMDRIDWFQYVIGSLQPILHHVSTAIQKLALEPGRTRPQELDKALTQITDGITQAEEGGIDLNKYLARSAPPTPKPPPATAEQLEHFFTTSHTLSPLFRSHPDIDHAFHLKRNGLRQLVTFSPELANQRPDTIRLLTFGDTLFTEILNEVKPPTDTDFGLMRLEAQPDGHTRVGWYWQRKSRTVPIRRLTQLEEALDPETPEPPPDGQAEHQFTEAVTNEANQRRDTLQRIDRERHSALISQGQHLLTRAAYTWAARQRTLFDPETPPIGDATLESMATAEGYPWLPLRQLAGHRIRLSQDSDTWQETITNTDHQLTNMWRSLKADAKQLTHRLAAAEHSATTNPPPSSHTIRPTTTHRL